MRRYVWIVRVCFLLVAGALGIGAVQARQGDEGELRGESGVTGQRQAIEFEVDGEGRPRHFATVLYLQCSGGGEWRMNWSASDGRPVDFEWDGDRLEVVERGDDDWNGGGSGRGVARLAGRITPDGFEGHMRMAFRYERGAEEAFCDSGHIPFAARPDAARRVADMSPAAQPWVAYPEDRDPARPGSPAQQRFLMKLDASCLQWWESRPARDASLEDYLRWHATELRALRALGSPPEGRAAHTAWLGAFGTHAQVERRQLAALELGDLRTAAGIAVRLAMLRAEANAAGLRLGLRTCTGTGPAGAPRS